MKANSKSNMGDSHRSEKSNNAQSRRSVTTPSGSKAGPPRMVNSGEGTTNSGSVQG